MEGGAAAPALRCDACEKETPYLSFPGSVLGHMGIWTALALVLLSLIDFHVYAMLAASTLREGPMAGMNFPLRVASGITTGEPIYRIWQSRLLGPYLVKLLGAVTDLPFAAAFIFTCIGLSVVKTFATFSTFSVITRRCWHAWFYTLMCMVLFIALQNHQPLYVWDWIDFTIFLLLVRGVALDLSDTYFILLFAVAIFNRETALFIGIWVGLRAFSVVRSGEGWRIEASRPFRLVKGLAMLIAGVVLVELIRSALFVKGTTDATMLDRGAGPYFHWKVPWNLTSFTDGFSGFADTQMWIGEMKPVLNVVLLVLAAFIGTHWRRLVQAAPQLTILLLGLLLTNVLFVELHEGRNYIHLVPVLALIHYVVFAHPSTAHETSL